MSFSPLFLSNCLDSTSILLCCEGNLFQLNMETSQLRSIQLHENALVTAALAEATSIIVANDQGSIYSLPFDGSKLVRVAFDSRQTCCALAADSTHLYVFNETGSRWA